MAEDPPADAIAVIGLACRFPGAATEQQFWRNLCGGEESLTFPSREQLIAAGVDSALVNRPEYVRAVSSIEGVDLFDPGFFGLTVGEARLMDPQQRIFLETAWHCMESAGYDPRSYDGPIGCFAGCSINTYMLWHLLADGKPRSLSEMLPMFLTNDKDFLSLQVAYRLNLTGPAITCQTACSTGLVAIHLAAQSILSGECDLALAGAVSIRPPEGAGYLFEDGLIQSPDGHTRPFDARAGGTLFGHGAGAVVLKRLDAAVRDGDRIRAVLLGTAVNNDGAAKATFHAPAIRGQSRVIAEAQEVAGIEPDSVAYVECHGTGTALGDPMEIEALTRAFRRGTTRTNFCAIGSVKSNFGHLEVAAGIAGFIKTALVVENGQIPPTLNFETPNPEIPFESSPFYVATRLEDWPPTAAPRVAGVSSFGMGGTNAHAILGAPPKRVRRRLAPERRPYLLALSAHEPEALSELAIAYADVIEAEPEALGDLCFTAHVGRAQLPWRRAFVADDPQAMTKLLHEAAQGGKARHVSGPPRPAFLFTGQGSQYAGLAAGLYESEPVFRAEFDRCAAAVADEVGVLLPQLAFDPTSQALRDTRFAQPVLFATEWSLAALLREWGIEPHAVAGHSLGEYVAASVAGVMSPEDAIRLVAVRGRLMSQTRGAMAEVEAPESVVRDGIAPWGSQLAIAAVNAPERIVVSGAEAALEAAVAWFGKEGIGAVRLKVEQAFHSAMIDPVLDSFQLAASDIGYRAPQIPLASNLTGELVETVDAAYWRAHARSTVQFERCVRTLAHSGADLFVELGPHPVLLGAATTIEPRIPGIALLRRGQNDTEQLTRALARLYEHGIAARGNRYYADRGYWRIDAPRLPFRRISCWVGPKQQARAPDERLHEITWVRAEQPTGQSNVAGWRIMGDVGQLDNILENAVAICADSLPVEQCEAWAPFGIIFARAGAPPGDDLAASTQRLAQQLRELGRANWRGPTVVLTKGAADGEPYAAAAGIVAQSIREEFPGARIRCLDASAGWHDPQAAAAVARELETSDTSEQIRLESSGRTVRRLRPLQPSTASPPIRADGTYLVTGGLGGVGRCVAHWLLEKGAHRVCLVGRSEASLETLAELSQHGDKLFYRRCDVIDEAGVRALVKDLCDPQAPLRGVFHAAGVYGEDGRETTPPCMFHDVMAPKVEGARNLHAATRDVELDHFVLFSSISSVFALPNLAAYGAANAALDGIAEQRRRQALPALSVSWGVWSEGGMTARLPHVQPLMDAAGLKPISQATGLRMLEAAMASRRAHVVAVPADWDRLAVWRPDLALMLNELVRSPAGVLPQANPAEAGAIVRGIVADVLGLDTVPDALDFVSLGGDSVAAAQVVGRARGHGIVIAPRDLFDRSLAELLAQLSGSVRERQWPELRPEPTAWHEPFPLTPVQEAYWVGRQTGQELGGVGTHGYLEFEFEALDLPRLEEALNLLISRHDMLRAVIQDDGMQRVLADVPSLRIPVLDLRAAEDAARAKAAEAVRAEMSHQVLPAGRWPLFDVRVTRLPGCDLLHVSVDSLILDAGSIRMALLEWGALYQGQDLPPRPAISFRDFVLGERRLRETEGYAEAKAYWTGRFADLASGPELPLRVQASAIGTPRFSRLSAVLPPRDWEALMQGARARGLTPTSVMLTAYAEVLRRWCRNKSFVLNLSVERRLPMHPDVDRLLGEFTGIELLVAKKPPPGASFETCARLLQEQLLEDLRHDQYSGVEVLRDISRHRGRLSGNIAPVVFTSLLNGRFGRGDRSAFFPGYRAQTFGISQTPQVWLDNKALEADDGGLVAEWDFVDDLFPEGLVAAMHAAYMRLLEHVARGAWDDRLDIFPAAARDKIDSANDTAAAAPDVRLHEPILHTARAAPERLAAIEGEHAWTFESVVQRADALGRSLAKRGLADGARVAILAESRVEAMAAALGILRARGCYVPIGTDWPPARIAQALDAAEVQAVVGDTKRLDGLQLAPHVASIGLDAPNDDAGETAWPRPAASDLSYIMFTSGSTGVPKGVAIEHAAVANTLADMNARFGVSAADRLFAVSAFTFDLSVWDMFGVAGAGGCVVFPRRGTEKDPGAWVHDLATHRITLWNSVPAFMEMLLGYIETAGIDRLGEAREWMRLVLLSGDWIPLELPDRIRRVFPNARIVSLGGATEAAIWSVLYEIEEVKPGWKSIPYGKAMRNQRLYVLDEDFEPCPEHVVGEICIEGLGLARGYWGDPEQTAERFCVPPNRGQRLYRTGDLGRLMPSGDIEFLGREDGQVKISGFRVELKEVEAHLLATPGVKQAVVERIGGRTDGRLVAYVIGGVDAETLHRSMRKILPGYMVPSQIVVLEAWPLTANGKIDRKTLAGLLSAENPQARARSGVPENALQAKLLDLWQTVLELDEPVGIDDSYLDLGGNSVHVARVMADLETFLGEEVPAILLFESTTIRELSAQLATEFDSAASLVRERIVS
ncbi:MAG: amino acid adenylation domain-containing protein [Rhizomicrobium sp.]